MSVDYLGWSIDFSALQMLVTLKIVSAAFNYTDGKRLSQGEKLSYELHNRLAIEEMPSLLEYFSYLFFFPAVLSGPIYELKHYLEYQQREKDLPHSATGEVLKRLGWAISISAAMVFLPKSSRDYLTPDFIRHLNVFQILLYAWYQNIYARLKYQAAWYYGEAGCISAGFGYEPEHKNHRGVIVPGGWYNVQQCDYIGVELSTNIQLYTFFFEFSNNTFHLIMII